MCARARVCVHVCVCACMIYFMVHGMVAPVFEGFTCSTCCDISSLMLSSACRTNISTSVRADSSLRWALRSSIRFLHAECGTSSVDHGQAELAMAPTARRDSCTAGCGCGPRPLDSSRRRAAAPGWAISGPNTICGKWVMVPQCPAVYPPAPVGTAISGSCDPSGAFGLVSIARPESKVRLHVPQSIRPPQRAGLRAFRFSR